MQITDGPIAPTPSPPITVVTPTTPAPVSEAPIYKAPAATASPVPPPSPMPPTPTTNPVDSQQYCGNGILGNGVCADPTLCCSKWGWCGTSDAHCGETPTPPTAAPTISSPMDPTPAPFKLLQHLRLQTMVSPSVLQTNTGSPIGSPILVANNAKTISSIGGLACSRESLLVIVFKSC
mmetsp:Transcript_29401/g.44523  ORF Transcript_29401/g.44523 Transcript_29401/m.44523 type:complete len:178 (+) Transcript_29401:798-1331(+)